MHVKYLEQCLAHNINEYIMVIISNTDGNTCHTGVDKNEDILEENPRQMGMKASQGGAEQGHALGRWCGLWSEPESSFCHLLAR